MDARGGKLASKTLFVRNLPFSTKDSDLEAVFSNYGPLKTCFTVKDKGVVEKCRGFGYVVFAVREDAEQAVSAVKVVGGRPVQVQFAKTKPPRDRSRKRPREQQEPTTGDAGGLEGGEGGAAYVGAGVHSPSASDGETASSDEDDYEAITGGEKCRKTSSRSQRKDPQFDVGRTVVVSNLPDGISKNKILKRGRKFGEITSLVYPLPERKIPTALITYSVHKEARNAVRRLCRKIYKGKELSAVLLSKENKAISSKTLKKSQLIVRNLSFSCTEEDLRSVFSRFGTLSDVRVPRKPNGRMLGFAFVQFTSYFDAMNALTAVNASKIKGRAVAVDWVVPKSVYEQASSSVATASHEQELEEPTDEEEAPLEAPENESDDGSDGDDVMADVDPDDDTEDDNMADDDVSGDEEEGEGGMEGKRTKATSSLPVKTKSRAPSADVKEGRTVFVRNIPFDIDEEELRQLFSRFGKVSGVQLVMNPETHMCKGAAFVKFSSPGVATACLEAYESSPDDIAVQGRQLDVFLALSRDEIEERRKERQSAAAGGGRGAEGSKMHNVMVDATKKGSNREESTDTSKRSHAQSSKLENPDCFLSKNRLSVRNLPTDVDEKALKQLFIDSIKCPLSQIKEVKIQRSEDRVNKEGLGRSKGFGFVQFSSHKIAVAALEATNDSPGLFGTDKKRKLIVEFAVENSRAVKKLRRGQEKFSTTASAVDEDVNETSLPSAPKKVLGKRSKWQLKWKKRREARKQRGKVSNKEELKKEGRNEDRTQMMVSDKEQSKKKGGRETESSQRMASVTLEKKASLSDLIAMYKQSFSSGRDRTHRLL